MHRHPYFDLWLHDDDELAAFLGSAIVHRATLHEWPLSCVQRLRDASGATHIYKVQAPPTVEPAFYQRARSSLLVAAREIANGDRPAALLLEDIQAPRLGDLPLAQSAKLDIVASVCAQIGQIDHDVTRGALPALTDIRTPALWATFCERLIDTLRLLAAGGIFQRVTAEMIERIAWHMQSPEVMAALEGPSGYLHADLCEENVLVLEDGYRVIDWQRPMWGPAALDRATLLDSVGIDPQPYVPPGVLSLRRLLSIDWFTQTAWRWFPPGAPTYDESIKRLAEGLEA